MYSQTIIIGNVGRDAELRYTPAGVPVCNFNVAVNRSWTDAKGEKQTDTTWWRVTAWRRLAEVAGAYVKKGMMVTVVGEQVTANGYADRNGAIAASLDITATTVKFMGGGQRDDDAEAPDETPDDTRNEVPF